MKHQLIMFPKTPKAKRSKLRRLHVKLVRHVDDIDLICRVGLVLCGAGSVWLRYGLSAGTAFGCMALLLINSK